MSRIVGESAPEARKNVAPAKGRGDLTNHRAQGPEGRKIDSRNLMPLRGCVPHEPKPPALGPGLHSYGPLALFIHGFVPYLVIVLCLFALPTLALADSSALILRGVSGDEDHEAKFAKWAAGTQKALIEKFGFSSDRVTVLIDKQTAQAEIQKAFVTLKQQLKPQDTFFLFLIGHGSGDNGQYKFNIFGPDYTADDYNKLLATLSVGRIVIVAATPASGAGLEKFAGKNRVVITATRSGQEVNDTVFYDYFLEALQGTAADEDKDQKVSVWEAFKYAVSGTERFYKEEGRLATEHPLISDNGSEKTDAKVKEPPLLARSTSFVVDRPIVSSDPKMQALLNQRKEIQDKIDALRLNKNSVPAAEYDKQMEDLLVALALKNQEIKQQETKK